MASQFQHRLIGAIIIVALGVILLPTVLDGEKNYYQDKFAAIPLIPEVNQQTTLNGSISVTEPLSDTPANLTTEAKPLNNGDLSPPITTIKAPQVTEQVNPNKNISKSMTKSIENAPKGQVFVIQLVALNSIEQVNALRAQLQLNGYRAFTLPAAPIQGKMTRIFVGPEISKAKLEAELINLKKLTGLDGIVRNQEIIK